MMQVTGALGGVVIASPRSAAGEGGERGVDDCRVDAAVSGRLVHGLERRGVAAEDRRRVEVSTGRTAASSVSMAQFD